MNTLPQPLQQLAEHREALVAVPFDPNEPYVALGTCSVLELTQALRALNKDPDAYWIGHATLAGGKFVLEWDQTVAATFGAAA